MVWQWICDTWVMCTVAAAPVLYLGILMDLKMRRMQQRCVCVCTVGRCNVKRWNTRIEEYSGKKGCYF